MGRENQGTLEVAHHRPRSPPVTPSNTQPRTRPARAAGTFSRWALGASGHRGSAPAVIGGELQAEARAITRRAECARFETATTATVTEQPGEPRPSRSQPQCTRRVPSAPRPACGASSMRRVSVPPPGVSKGRVRMAAVRLPTTPLATYPPWGLGACGPISQGNFTGVS